MENGKSSSSLLLVAGLSFDLAAAAEEMMFVGGSKSREGRRGIRIRNPPSLLASCPPSPMAGGASPPSSTSPAVAVSRFVDVAF